MEAASHPWPTLGVLLLRDGLVSKEDLESVLDAQRDSRSQRVSGRRLGELLVDRGFVTREQVAKLVAEQYELPFIELGEADVDARVAARLPEELARSFDALPISELPGGSLLVAIADPATVLFAEDLRQKLEAPLRFAVVPPDAMDSAIERVYSAAPEPAPDEPREPSAELAVVEQEQDGDEAPDGRYLGSSGAVAQLWPPLGALLIREGLITDAELDAALAQQKLSRGKRLGEILVERGTVTRTEVAKLVAEQYELPFVDLAADELDPTAPMLLPAEIARRYAGLPIGFEPDGSLRVAIADPASVLYSDELRQALDVPVHFSVAAPDAIEQAIAQAYGAAPGTDGAPAPPEPALPAAVVLPLREDTVDTDAGAVDETIASALELGATDIHFTPRPDEIAVRVRVGGELRELETLPATMQAAVSARLRSLAQLDDANRQAPQEGRIVFEHGDGATGLRVVLLPTAYGDKATLHVLKEFSLPSSLAELGMSSEVEESFRNAIGGESGLVLVCGPEGSGCSTTLYAALRELNTAERALATIEDPVEQMVPGVDQVEVDEEAGLTYEMGLRAILLSDPDVVLVGELNDSATATGAMRAAVSGRLVLSRLHVLAPAEASERLLDLGVDRGAVSATLACVVAQRLVRRVCPDCREPYYPSEEELAELDRPADEVGRRLLARGSGCVACGGSGLRGRIAIFEVLTITDEMRDLLARGGSADDLRSAAASNGMPTLREEGIRLCLEGETTVSELRRLTAAAPEPSNPAPDPFAGEG